MAAPEANTGDDSKPSLSPLSPVPVTATVTTRSNNSSNVIATTSNCNSPYNSRSGGLRVDLSDFGFHTSRDSATAAAAVAAGAGADARANDGTAVGVASSSTSSVVVATMAQAPSTCILAPPPEPGRFTDTESARDTTTNIANSSGAAADGNDVSSNTRDSLARNLGGTDVDIGFFNHGDRLTVAPSHGYRPNDGLRGNNNNIASSVASGSDVSSVAPAPIVLHTRSVPVTMTMGGSSSHGNSGSSRGNGAGGTIGSAFAGSNSGTSLAGTRTLFTRPLPATPAPSLSMSQSLRLAQLPEECDFAADVINGFQAMQMCNDNSYITAALGDDTLTRALNATNNSSRDPTNSVGVSIIADSAGLFNQQSQANANPHTLANAYAPSASVARNTLATHNSGGESEKKQAQNNDARVDELDSSGSESSTNTKTRDTRIISGIITSDLHNPQTSSNANTTAHNDIVLQQQQQQQQEYALLQRQIALTQLNRRPTQLFNTSHNSSTQSQSAVPTPTLPRARALSNAHGIVSGANNTNTNGCVYIDNNTANGSTSSSGANNSANSTKCGSRVRWGRSVTAAPTPVDTPTALTPTVITPHLLNQYYNTPDVSTAAEHLPATGRIPAVITVVPSAHSPAAISQFQLPPPPQSPSVHAKSSATS